ncbi:hypothetical protein BC477_02740 [Clavibacter michiganensis subsp. michiganensis]|uniref:Uncharacterized protein n=1 Tax=Clavibacter michiganensis subsp. michiganensis TaxID=33013 RepID=A0A251XKR3_CLAMM|nr:hypothetical protein BC477_02740 [Clavibacter michiganensis subsp. michiganensis]OUE03628.1 hypothetical protein CMMCAS07_01675 [Clavibacter michiganensis subsp. michiganensis]
MEVLERAAAGSGRSTWPDPSKPAITRPFVPSSWSVATTSDCPTTAYSWIFVASNTSSLAPWPPPATLCRRIRSACCSPPRTRTYMPGSPVWNDVARSDVGPPPTPCTPSIDTVYAAS